jgi:hypothetical protein
MNDAEKIARRERRERIATQALVAVIGKLDNEMARAIERDNSYNVFEFVAKTAAGFANALMAELDSE